MPAPAIALLTTVFSLLKMSISLTIRKDSELESLTMQISFGDKLFSSLFILVFGR